MPRHEPTACFEKRGVWIFSRYRCTARGLSSARCLNRGAYDRMLVRQEDEPVLVLSDANRRRNLWLFRSEFYWEEDTYAVEAVQAFILEHLARRERRVQRALALMERVAPAAVAQRRAIPTPLRVLVWNRDGGRCVDCGAESGLQFDHVIPLALGGATAAENLQLLCEDCNRAKGASLA
jgi:hypothetical protein